MFIHVYMQKEPHATCNSMKNYLYEEEFRFSHQGATLVAFKWCYECIEVNDPIRAIHDSSLSSMTQYGGSKTITITVVMGGS